MKRHISLFIVLCSLLIAFSCSFDSSDGSDQSDDDNNVSDDDSVSDDDGANDDDTTDDDQAKGVCCSDLECRDTIASECTEDHWLSEKTCSQNPCPEFQGGSCCLSDGGYCKDGWSEEVCQNQNLSTWHQGQNCELNPCVFGACCSIRVDGDYCENTITEEACQNEEQLSWSWFEDQSCSQNPCAFQQIGACCLGYQCLNNFKEPLCENLGGTWHSAQTCDDDPCGSELMCQ